MPYEHVGFPQPIRLGGGLSTVGSPPQTICAAETSDNTRRPHLTLVPDPFGVPALTPDNPAREAKRICLGCEVRDACLDYALAHDERFGIGGGLSGRERRRLKRGII